MYGRAALFTCLGVGVVLILWIAQVTFLRSSDIASYSRFIEKTKKVATTQPLSGTTQERQGVRKDIWFTQEDKSRLHTRIDSEGSTLTLLPTGDKLDIIEHLHQLKCWKQEKLYAIEGAPMQEMRFFEANEGSYRYTTGQFLAEAVTLFLFRIPKHNLPQKVDPKEAFLRGIAKDIAFSVAGKSTQFQAESFKATLNSEEVR